MECSWPAGRDPVQVGVGRALGAVLPGGRVVAGEEAGTQLVGEVEDRGGQAEGLDDVGVDVFRVWRARDPVDHLAEQAEGEVRVLEGGVLGDDDPRLRQFGQHLFPAGEVEVAPGTGRRLGDQPGAVGQQSPERHPFHVAADGAGRGELGDVLHQRVLQREPALVPQPQDRRGGEGLGHRGDAGDRLLGGLCARIEIRRAEAAEPGELPVADDAEGHAGESVFGDLGLRQALDLRDQALEDAIGHSESPCARTASGVLPTRSR